MSSQRELVQAMIRRRVTRAKKLKEDGRIKMDPRELIMRFLGEFDERLASCDSIVEKYWLIESESQRLLSDIHRIDPDANIELIWFGEDADSMRLEGIRVFWGEDYKIKHELGNVSVFDLTMILFAD